MKIQVLHTVWCHISCEAAGEFWHSSLSGVKGISDWPTGYSSHPENHTPSTTGFWTKSTKRPPTWANNFRTGLRRFIGKRRGSQGNVKCLTRYSLTDHGPRRGRGLGGLSSQPSQPPNPPSPPPPPHVFGQFGPYQLIFFTNVPIPDDETLTKNCMTFAKFLNAFLAI